MTYKSFSTQTSLSDPAPLTDEVRALIAKAREATSGSYSPYSNFRVGAALLLENGVTITGSNQENAAYPSGLCAERVAMFYANSQYPGVAIRHLVIVARSSGGYVQAPISPCGACRQVMVEVESRQSGPMQVWLVGETAVYAIPKATDLMPLAFISASLEGK